MIIKNINFSKVDYFSNKYLSNGAFYTTIILYLVITMYTSLFLLNNRLVHVQL